MPLSVIAIVLPFTLLVVLVVVLLPHTVGLAGRSTPSICRSARDAGHAVASSS